MFTCPGLEISDAYTQISSATTVWNYRYNVFDRKNSAAGVGVPHNFEIPAIFGADSNDNGDGSSYQSYNAAIVPVLMDYWISFVRALNPNNFKSVKAPVWKPYLGDSRILLQTNDTKMEKVPKAQVDRCKFWKGLGVKMEQ